MEDHGNTEEFILRGGTSPQTVTADELDSWLDTLQAIPTMGKVIVVYDACRSGSFISRLTPPAGKIRLTLTSSTPDQTAYFLSNNHSFSSHFWSTFSGKSGNKAIMTEALNRAASNMASYQASQLDANGNGVPNEPEDYTSLAGHEGTIYAMRRQYNLVNRSKPVIPIISGNQAANGTSAELMAKSVYDVDGDGIKRVWAEIYGPDFNHDHTDETVTDADLQPFTLPGPNANDEYKANYTGFTVNGTYIITYYAEDNSGIYSLPSTSLITKSGGTTVNLPDQYEDDDSYQDAKIIVPNSPTPQNHSFHVSGDVDWVMFYGVAGQVYNIRAMNPTIISDPEIALFSSVDSNFPLTIDSQYKVTGGPGEEEAIIGWPCTEDGLYSVRITNNSSHWGANVRYKLKIYNPIALSLPGYITGRITSNGNGIAGAIVRAGGGTAITLADGSYIMYLGPGNYTASVSFNGYPDTSFGVTVGSGQHTGVSDVDMNSVPNILNTPSTSVTANDFYSYIPVVVDIDGDPHTFAISGKPGWASFSTINGKLWGTPAVSDEGIHGLITITVTDNGGASDSVVFNIEVMNGGTGSLPAIYFLLLRP